jgi:UDP-glucose 4-epimerase
MSKQETYLVTGGAGFIGTNLVHTLVQNGKKVIVVDDLSAGDAERLPKEITFHKLDIRDTSALTELCQDVDVIVHLAAIPSVPVSIEKPQETSAVNVDGTISVLEAAKNTGVRRVVFAASAAYYGNHQTLPLKEDLSPCPETPYALQKYFGEQLMKLWSELYNIETVSLRFFNVYGPYMDPDGAYASIIGRFLRLTKTNQPLAVVGDGSQTRDFVHVSDVVTAICQAAEAKSIGKGEIFNVGTGIETSVLSIAKLFGGEITYLPARIEVGRSCANIEKAKKELNWEPRVEIAEGLTELIEN